MNCNVTTYIDHELVARIDAVAKQRSTTRTAIIRETLAAAFPPPPTTTAVIEPALPPGHRREGGTIVDEGGFIVEHGHPQEGCLLADSAPSQEKT